MFDFGSGSRKKRHIPPPRPESDPSKFPSYPPVIPIPPYLIAPTGFPPTNNGIPNPNPPSLHPFAQGQFPPSRTGSFSMFPNTSPYSDSNSNLNDFNGPPVIPVPDGKGGFMLAAGFNPDGSVISQPAQPPQQQQQLGMGRNTNGHQAQWFPPGPSVTSTNPPLYSGPMPPPTRPSRVKNSGPPPPWLASAAAPAPQTHALAPAQILGPAPPVPPPYSSPYAMPPQHGPQGPVTSPPIHNTTEMTRENLLAVLDYFSETLEDYFDLGPLLSPNGTPPHLTPPYGAASWSSPGNGNGQGSSKVRPTTLRMAVHGGACMILHEGLRKLYLDLPLAESSHQADAHGGGSGGERPIRISKLSRRTTTRDVDIILRGFVADYGALGPPPNPGERARRNPSYPGEGQSNDPNPDSPTRVSHLDAASRLKACIRNTTRAFPGLGLDWMNADADVSLPLAADPQTTLTFDPICRPTFTNNNMELFTIYTSPNKRLTLVSVPPYWSIALKIARWGQRDWADVGIWLRAGTLLSKSNWTEEALLEWLKKYCWAMGFAIWEERRINELKEKIREAVEMFEGWEPGSPGHYSQPARRQEREEQREIPNTVREHVRDWGSREERKKSKSRARTRARSRSKSRGRPEIFIPPDKDGYDLEYEGGYQERDFYEPRGRAHHRHHPSHHNQLMQPPPSHSHGPSSGPLSQATAIVPFYPQPQNHPRVSHNTQQWHRQASRSKNRDNKKAKKAKLRDRQRRRDHQRRDEMRSEWNAPSDSESETESEESEDDSSENSDDEEDKENRDRRRAWRRANIYAPSKKRPTPLNLPNTFSSPPPVNPFVQQQSHQQNQQFQQPAMAQPQLQPHLQNGPQSSPSRPPPSPGAPPIDAGPAALAQYQFERQMLSLESERRREKQVRETIGRVAGRVMARGHRGG